MQHHYPFWLLASHVAGFLCMGDLSDAGDDETGYDYGYDYDLNNVEGYLNGGLK